MNKDIIKIIYLILILLIIKLGYDYFGTKRLVDNYEKGIYLNSLAKSLTYFNIDEPYIARYNMGNIHYQDGDYLSAIHEYEKALKGKVPNRKECRIRINYALAICNLVEVDESDEESVNKAIELYELAIDVLIKDRCATKDGHGHDKDAQQLEIDIQREIDRLKSKESEPEEEEGGEDEDEPSNPDEPDEDIDEIEKKMQEVKEEAISKQREYEHTVDKLYNLKDIFLNNSSSKKW